MKTAMTAMTAVVLAAGVAAAQTAVQDLRITEIYVGIDGEDGTPDWIEVTNYGTSSYDMADFAYDDVNPSLAAGGFLPSFSLAAGKSVVVLVEAEAADLALFDAIWGMGIDRIFTEGGGSLGQNGDSAFLLDATTGLPVVGAIYNASVVSNFATIDVDYFGVQMISQVGVNGAYESNAFFNDNLGTPDNMTTLIGSPGRIPAPGVAGLLGVAGVVAGRRRR